MPRLRSQTGFTGILPPELVERCVEYLPFEEVHTTVKQLWVYGRNDWENPRSLNEVVPDGE